MIELQPFANALHTFSYWLPRVVFMLAVVTVAYKYATSK